MTKAEFEAHYREHFHQTYGLCRRLLGNTGDAEDATQEAFMRGYRNRRSYRPDQPFGAWIHAIARNYCIDVLRRTKRLATAVTDTLSLPFEPVDPATNGVARLISAHDAAAVSRAVDALPDPYRLPIVLAYYADATYDEIASTLGVTRNHVGVLLLRGKQRLRTQLAELNQEI